MHSVAISMLIKISEYELIKILSIIVKRWHHFQISIAVLKFELYISGHKV